MSGVQQVRGMSVQRQRSMDIYMNPLHLVKFRSLRNDIYTAPDLLFLKRPGPYRANYVAHNVPAWRCRLWGSGTLATAAQISYAHTSWRLRNISALQLYYLALPYIPAMCQTRISFAAIVGYCKHTNSVMFPRHAQKYCQSSNSIPKTWLLLP